jgi:hypothetical protein
MGGVSGVGQPPGHGEPPEMGKTTKPGGTPGHFSLGAPGGEKAGAAPGKSEMNPALIPKETGPVEPSGNPQQAGIADMKKEAEKSMMKITHSMLHQLQQNFKTEQQQDWGSGASGGGCC